MDLVQAKPQTIVFNNQKLITFEKDGIQYTAIKPICENIGIDWESQRQRIMRDDVLNSTACMIKVVAEDGVCSYEHPYQWRFTRDALLATS